MLSYLKESPEPIAFSKMSALGWTNPQRRSLTISSVKDRHSLTFIKQNFSLPFPGFTGTGASSTTVKKREGLGGKRIPSASMIQKGSSNSDHAGSLCLPFLNDRKLIQVTFLLVCMASANNQIRQYVASCQLHWINGAGWATEERTEKPLESQHSVHCISICTQTSLILGTRRGMLPAPVLMQKSTKRSNHQWPSDDLEQRRAKSQQSPQANKQGETQAMNQGNSCSRRRIQIFELHRILLNIQPKEEYCLI